MSDDLPPPGTLVIAPCRQCGLGVALCVVRGRPQIAHFKPVCEWFKLKTMDETPVPPPTFNDA